MTTPITVQSAGFSSAPQLLPDDLPAIAAAGYRAIAMLAASTRLLLQGRAVTGDGSSQQALEKNCMLSADQAPALDAPLGGSRRPSHRSG